MVVFNLSDIQKHIKNGEYLGCYYFYGRDVAAVEDLTSLLIKKITKASPGAYSKMDGAKLDLNAFEDIAVMYPMFTEYNCILINDLNADSLNADAMKKLLNILEKASDKTIIIFNITGFDLKQSKKTLSAKNKKLIDYIAKIGGVCELDFKTVSEMAKSIINKAERRGCSISKRDAEYLAQLCRCDTMLVRNETEKLCAYASGAVIDAVMINNLVSKQLDASAFSLAKAVTALKADEAMRILDDLILLNSDGISVLSAISSSFIDLYRAKLTLSYNKKQGDAVEDFGYKGRDFIIRNAMDACRRISLETLRECIRILCSADLAVKSTRTDSRIIIEKAIISMLVLIRRGTNPHG